MAKKKKRKKKATKKAVRTKRKVVRRRRTLNPVSLAKSILSKVVRPGVSFSLTTLKAKLKSAGYRNVKGWFESMILDARRRGLLTKATQTLYVFTPAAVRNPCPWAKPIARKKKGKVYRR